MTAAPAMGSGTTPVPLAASAAGGSGSGSGSGSGGDGVGDGSGSGSGVRTTPNGSYGVRATPTGSPASVAEILDARQKGEIAENAQEQQEIQNLTKGVERLRKLIDSAPSISATSRLSFPSE